MSGSTTDGFSAWVSVGGMKLPQYGVETTIVKGVKTVTCWIASEVGKAFEVGYSLPTYPEQLSGNVWVDGISIGGYTHLRGKPDIGGQSSMRVSDTIARPLIFSRTEFTDEDAYLDANPDELGKIVVTIWVVESPQPATPIYDNQQQPTKIHERTKKATSHRVAFGEEFTTIKPKNFLECTYVRNVITFIFQYRPREYLQAEGIVPLDPKPVVRSRKRAAETLEPSTSEDEGEVDVQARDKESRLGREQLRIEREELEAQRRELRIQKEEFRIQLDAARANTRRQKKKAKLEPQP